MQKINIKRKFNGSEEIRINRERDETPANYDSTKCYEALEKTLIYRMQREDKYLEWGSKR